MKATGPEISVRGDDEESVGSCELDDDSIELPRDIRIRLDPSLTKEMPSLQVVPRFKIGHGQNALECMDGYLRATKGKLGTSLDKRRPRFCFRRC
jgi:hypothetical protein